MAEKLNDFYDAIIIGGGPSGLSSAIYMARAKYKCLVIEKDKFGGQITITEEVVNYPGVYRTSGKKLTKEMQRQAESFGAEFLLSNVDSFERDGEFYSVKTDKGNFKTLGIIIATGASPRVIGFDGEEKFKGRGVAYCATCDGEFFTGKDIIVIGSGFAACEESLFLTRFAKKVYIMIRGNDFTCTGSVVEEVKANENIEIFYNTETVSVSGQSFVTDAAFNQEGKELKFHDENGIGVFVFAGYLPASANFKEKIALNEQNYIITDENQKTNLDGVYAGGDICIKNLRQVVTAVSDGAKASTSLEKYIQDKYEKLGLPKREYANPKRNEESANAASNDAQNAKSDDQGFISSDIIEQLMPVFDRFESDIMLKYKTESNDIGREVDGFMKEFGAITSKVSCVHDENIVSPYLPTIEIYDKDGKSSGVQFHGVPGGHEFNSFVIGLYNFAGPGQKIAPELEEAIKAIDKKIDLKVAVTLSCTNCPDLVIALERIALMNPNITLEIFDLSQFEMLKTKHNIMSVPCLIVNDSEIHFGKKDIKTVLDIILGE